MFNLSETIIPRSMTNLPNSVIQSEHMFAQGELSLQNFLTDSYSNCFKLLNKFWNEGIRVLKLTKEKCFELKPDLADHLTQEFQDLEILENFKLGSTASKDNFEEVKSNIGRRILKFLIPKIIIFNKNFKRRRFRNDPNNRRRRSKRSF
jgi:hypothetical protein